MRAEVPPGLAYSCFLAIDANAHACNRDSARRACRAENDKYRLVKQVTVVVVLANLEHDITIGDTGVVTDIEQQEKLFTHTDVQILQDLCLGQCTVMNSHEPQLPLPLAVTGNLIAQYKGKTVVPINQTAPGNRIDVIGEQTVDIQAPAIDRIVGCDDVLQGCLQVFVVISG